MIENHVERFLNNMFVDTFIPDTVDNIVLVTGDHLVFGDSVKVYRRLKIYEKNGEVNDYNVHTNNKMHTWYFKP